MFHLEVLAERLPLTSIFQNITSIHYVQRQANVTKIAKFNLPSIYTVTTHKSLNELILVVALSTGVPLVLLSVILFIF